MHACITLKTRQFVNVNFSLRRRQKNVEHKTAKNVKRKQSMKPKNPEHKNLLVCVRAAVAAGAIVADVAAVRRLPLL